VFGTNMWNFISTVPYIFVYAAKTQGQLYLTIGYKFQILMLQKPMQ